MVLGPPFATNPFFCTAIIRRSAPGAWWFTTGTVPYASAPHTHMLFRIYFSSELNKPSSSAFTMATAGFLLRDITPPAKPDVTGWKRVLAERLFSLHPSDEWRVKRVEWRATHDRRASCMLPTNGHTECLNYRQQAWSGVCSKRTQFYIPVCGS